jgi:lactoylglutathione lyase
VQYIHTCYRVLDLDRSIEFYTDKLGLELARKVPIGDDATNAFLAVPGDPEPRLELTLNHDREEPYALGEGYSHVAFAVEDLDALAEKLERAGCKTPRSGRSVAPPLGARVANLLRKEGRSLSVNELSHRADYLLG